VTGATPDELIPCAGGIVFDDRRRLLLIKRGHEPGRGLWSVPGGRCEPGETTATACVRELMEETGLIVEVISPVGSVIRPATRPGVSYLIEDFRCRVVGGTLRAGDDASDARWVTSQELVELPLTAGLLSTLRDWGTLPAGAAG
jgi:ADP-ribose pyrophosphatase YjhB (NUDIX family)